jgi:hypothetical protein
VASVAAAGGATPNRDKVTEGEGERACTVHRYVQLYRDTDDCMRFVSHSTGTSKPSSRSATTTLAENDGWGGRRKSESHGTTEARTHRYQWRHVQPFHGPLAGRRLPRGIGASLGCRAERRCGGCSDVREATAGGGYAGVGQLQRGVCVCGLRQCGACGRRQEANHRRRLAPRRLHQKREGRGQGLRVVGSEARFERWPFLQSSMQHTDLAHKTHSSRNPLSVVPLSCWIESWAKSASMRMM